MEAAKEMHAKELDFSRKAREELDIYTGAIKDIINTSVLVFQEEDLKLAAICLLYTSVISITVYMVINGTPALFQVGIREILFGTAWKPTAENPSFGILYVILTSIIGTALAVLLGVPIGILTAVFLAETAPRKLAALVKPAVELLAGIPSVVYGCLLYTSKRSLQKILIRQ